MGNSQRKPQELDEIFAKKMIQREQEIELAEVEGGKLEQFQILYTNIDGMTQKKKEKLQKIISVLKPDVIVLVEMKLTPKSKNLAKMLWNTPKAIKEIEYYKNEKKSERIKWLKEITGKDYTDCNKKKIIKTIISKLEENTDLPKCYRGIESHDVKYKHACALGLFEDGVCKDKLFEEKEFMEVNDEDVDNVEVNDKVFMGEKVNGEKVFHDKVKHYYWYRSRHAVPCLSEGESEPKGGKRGVSVYLRNEHKFINKAKIGISKSVGFIRCSIETPQRNMFDFTAVYVNQTNSLDIVKSFFKKYLPPLPGPHQPKIIVGDFNVNLLPLFKPIDQYTEEEKSILGIYLEQHKSCQLKIFNTTATNDISKRQCSAPNPERAKRPTLKDHIFSDIDEKCITVLKMKKPLNCDLGDHCLLLVKVDIIPKKAGKTEP